MAAGLPQASFVAMVDAVLCAVSIIIIVIVALPASQTGASFVPQADIVVGCVIRDGLDFSVSVRVAKNEKPFDELLIKGSDLGLTEQVVAVRRRLVEALSRIDALSARVGVVFTGQDWMCLDAVACALATRREQCPRSDISFTALDDKSTPVHPVVTIIYSAAPAGRQ